MIIPAYTRATTSKYETVEGIQIRKTKNAYMIAFGSNALNRLGIDFNEQAAIQVARDSSFPDRLLFTKAAWEEARAMTIHKLAWTPTGLGEFEAKAKLFVKLLDDFTGKESHEYLVFTHDADFQCIKQGAYKE